MKRNYTLFFIVLIFHSYGVFSQTSSSRSASITQGLATTTNANIFPGCAGSRVSAVGTITSSDALVWTVPAETNFITGPYLPDLYNQCSGVMPANIAAVNLNSLPVTVIDNGGDTITAFLLGDNYSELYINDVLVGVDPVPYTPFNSCVVKFKVSRPYTIALKLVDWEENLGLGTELNNGNPYHAGDGGFIAQFSDGTVTDSSWKAQTFYIAPIEDVATVVELPDGTRSSSAASTTPSCDLNCYGFHYEIPNDWKSPTFNDGGWPNASLYSAATVGVNFPAYTNFSSQWNNAQFIWASNLILDNLVLVRKTVGSTTGIESNESDPVFGVVSPFGDKINFISGKEIINTTIILYDIMGKQIQSWKQENIHKNENTSLKLKSDIPNGNYILKIQGSQFNSTTRLVHQTEFK
ncbi:MAG: T9SS type A sorting domain-containing protein [Bacteroidetes bacterium]|nr:T9SS type A sorting domain-containing protein [Bacteroidota bacterium]